MEAGEAGGGLEPGGSEPVVDVVDACDDDDDDDDESVGNIFYNKLFVVGVGWPCWNADDGRFSFYNAEGGTQQASIDQLGIFNPRHE